MWDGMWDGMSHAAGSRDHGTVWKTSMLPTEGKTFDVIGIR